MAQAKVGMKELEGTKRIEGVAFSAPGSVGLGGTEVQKGAGDLVCIAHLRWDFVFQRPQHLMRRFAQGRRVFYLEEPVVEPVSAGHTVGLKVRTDAETGVIVATPYLDKEATTEQQRAAHKAQIDELFERYAIDQPILWYYTPMLLGVTRHLPSSLIVYDCMDDLASFKNAPPNLAERERELMEQADLVFTGGLSLYEARRNQHPNIHPFPSSIDRQHFARARGLAAEPADQAAIPHPRLGYFGVIDERIDLGLLTALADSRPDWQIILVGPVAKLDEADLPQRANLHYLGMKDYSELPAYLSGWDVALMPFALNDATRFISPTKTPEYLAGGKPVISTPIRDVVRPYGENGLVWIADTVSQFIRATEAALGLNGHKQEWLARVDRYLEGLSWDRTFEQMNTLILDAQRELDESERVDISLPEGGMTGESVSLPPDVTLTPRPRPQRQSGGITQFDYLIVGAGFAGAVLAERLAVGSGKKVLLIDKRNHIAGNAYDHYNDEGVLVHKYGPHIFHTNSKEVFVYLSRFTDWRSYEHRVRASVDGQLLPMPINLDTVNQLYGLNLSSFELEKFFESVAERRDPLVTSEDVVVNKIGRLLYEKFFRNYTRKQWSLDPSELDASVTSRVPIRLNRDDRYFSDTYQSMPLRGYTRMFENMLDHPNIKILLNTDYHEILNAVRYDEMVFTGPVDEFFDFRYGKLPYRSLQFKFETHDKEWMQPVAVLNYPNEHAYTRVTEFKHLTGQQHPKTSLVYEFPCAEGDPYYPIPRPENAELYKKYKALAEATPGVHFAGRLATYRYYNMDQVVGQALTVYAKITGQKRSESIQTYQPTRFTIDLPCTLLGAEETL